MTVHKVLLKHHVTSDTLGLVRLSVYRRLSRRCWNPPGCFQCQEVLDAKEKRDENPERNELCLACARFCKTAQSLRKTKQHYEHPAASNPPGQTYDKRPCLPTHLWSPLAANLAAWIDSGVPTCDQCHKFK